MSGVCTLFPEGSQLLNVLSLDRTIPGMMQMTPAQPHRGAPPASSIFAVSPHACPLTGPLWLPNFSL